ncbi:MAG: RNA polymerase sigma factor [Niabella sp.]
MQTIEIALDEQVELCRSGDTRAYFDVYQQYARPMLNSSMRILNNLADAEDMVQEAFVDAFRNLGSFTYKSSFEAWLRRIVINKSISLLRKRKVNWIEVDEERLNAEGEVAVDEEQMDFDIKRIKDAIATLPDNHRIVFNLFAVDGVPQEEIAKLLGISHNNVRTIYHRAKKKILEQIQSNKYAARP